MKRLLVLLVAAIVAVGACVYFLRPDRIGSPGAGAPTDAAPASPLKGGSPAGVAAPPVKLKLDVPVPEHLQNPSALDPVPLSLNFSAPPFERQKDGRIFKTDALAAARDLNREDREPIEDLHLLDLLVGSYRTIFRENPVAPGNRQVVEALTGKNPSKLVFIDPAHPAIGPTGELTDRWGTPYRFHPISGIHMEYSSAGEDRHVGTPDDVHLMRPDLGGDSGPGT